MYRLADHWTEEGELQCGCPHITQPRGEVDLCDEPSWEAHSVSWTSSLWRLSRRYSFHRIAAGMGWWAAGVVLNPFQYISWLYSVRWYIVLPVAHDNCKRFVSAGNYFVLAAVSGSRAQHVLFFCRNTCVESRKSFWMNVAGDAWVLLGLVAPDPRGSGAAVWRWMPRPWGGWYKEHTGDPQGLATDDCKSSL